MQIEVGRSYFNRAGAVVRVISVQDSGYQKRHPVTWAPIGRVSIIHCEIVCRADGREGAGQRYGLLDTGFYQPTGEHDLDLVRAVEVLQV